MGIFTVLLLMLFLHIVDDYYLQGILAKMKQRKWWEENAPDKKYKNDYIVALIMHAFSWTFCIMLPILLYFNMNPQWTFYIIFAINVMVHALVDNAKANRHSINLITDQAIHICQIVLSWLYIIILINF